jgi:S1-C subfamily serine protease
MAPVAFGQVPLTTAQIAKKVSPSVVIIQGKADSGDMLGSGFIISKDGKIVTNLHVIRDMKTASVHLPSRPLGKGWSVEPDPFDSVSVLATDERRDLAIIKIAGSDLPVLELGNSDALTVGEPLVIVGSPQGLEGTVTAGILSSVRDASEGFTVLQTDAAVNPGNSGGPLLNNKGQAVGVVSFKLRSTEGLNFAIPINYVRRLLTNLHEPMSLAQMRQHLNPTGPSQEPGASLKETLEWLKSHIPTFAGEVRYVVAANDGARISYDYQSAVWSLDSCDADVGFIMLQGVTKPAPDRGSNTSLTTFRDNVPLGALTTGSVERHDNALDNETYISGERWVYRLTLASALKNLYWTVEFFPSRDSANHMIVADHRKVGKLTLPFSDESVAQRVLKAFLHAAELCRRNEPF